MKNSELLALISKDNLPVQAMSLKTGEIVDISDITYCPEKNIIILNIDGKNKVNSKYLKEILKEFPAAKIILNNRQPVIKVIIAVEEICFLFGGF